MSVELIKSAMAKGAHIYASVSGGKDGQAMVKALLNWCFEIRGLIHADLGRIEWPQSLAMCERLSEQTGIPLFIVRRSDGLGLLEYWKRRMFKLIGKNVPFWSSSANRYCTSDTKRGPIDVFFTSCHDFVISCEGVRAEESKTRAKKNPLEIRRSKTSSFYNGMSVEEAIAAYKPGKRLVLTWYPVFGFTVTDVWATFNMRPFDLTKARTEYKSTGVAPSWWPFHPAYAMGNDRVSCMFCVLGSLNDLQNAAVQNPALLNELIALEDQSGFTFKNNWSLKNLLN